MTISCDCKVKTNISLNETYQNIIYFDDIEIDSNFGLIKCYNLVFSLKGKLNNIGFWIFLILEIIHIPLLFYFFCKGIQGIKNYLINEMKINGYIKDSKKNENLNTKSDSKNNKVININFPPLKYNKIGNKSKQSNKLKVIDNSSITNIKSSKEIVNNINNNSNINDYKEIKEKKNKTRGIKKKLKKKKKIKKKVKTKILSKDNIIHNSKNISILQTQGISAKEQNQNNNQESNKLNLNLIKINLNDIEEYMPESSNYTLKNYTFEEAIKQDYRPLLKIFFVFLLSKQTVFHTFLYRSPLEPFSLRLCLLIFIISSDLALNSFFYLDDIISKKYKYAKGLFLFTFSNNLTIVILSTVIGFVFMALFKYLSNPENKIREIFTVEEEKIKKNKKYVVSKKRKMEILGEVENVLKRYKMKVIIFAGIEFSLSLFFWYYVTAFCHVYSSTQASWIFDIFFKYFI